MIMSDFYMENEVGRLWYFQKRNLLVNIKIEIILVIYFLKLNNSDILFKDKMLVLRCHTINKALSTTKRVKIVDLKKFVIMA